MEEGVAPAVHVGDAVACMKCTDQPTGSTTVGAIAEGLPRCCANVDILKYLQSLEAKLPNAVACKSTLPRTTCAVCCEEFSCRGALFGHIRKKGHAALTVRPLNAIAFADPAAEAATIEFLRSLLVNLEAELPPGFAEYSKTIDSSTLTAMLDSGESILTVVVARLLTCPPHGESRQVLLKLVKQVSADVSAIWQSAQDFEVFSIPGLSSTIGVDYANATSQPWDRPRSMWGLPPAITDLSPIGLARRDVEVGSENEVGTCTELLKALLPVDFDFEEECVVCAAKTFMCCGPAGLLARVDGCGCVTCPDGMQTWIEVQIDTEQKGTGEVGCAGCSSILSQQQLDSFCPVLAPVAERIGLEKALVGMTDWKWCEAGCGSGGFLSGVKMSSDGCRTMHCPTCDVGACMDCGVLTTYHTTASGSWRSCEEAIRERDGARATEAWLSEKAKRCPQDHGGCGALTQRDGGCSHITCRVCKFEWCWLCEGKYQGKYTLGTTCPCG